MVKIVLSGVKPIRKKMADGSVRLYYYHRASGVRLPDDPVTPEFLAALKTLNTPPRERTEPDAKSFARLIQMFYTSPEWRQLADASRREYRRYLTVIEDIFGHEPVESLKREHIITLRDHWGDRPRSANYLVQTIKRLLNFGVDRGFRNDNPATRITALKTGPGHKPWTSEMIESFRATHPAGVPMRTALELGIGTGQRKGDILKMTWHDYDGTGIAVTQGKTGTKLWIPCHETLKSYLDKLERRAPAILTTDTGKPFLTDHFSHSFRSACDAANLPKATFHGLRHAAATALAEAGCDTRDIMAITGHRSEAMVARYTRTANQRLRATAAIARLERKKNPEKHDD